MAFSATTGAGMLSASLSAQDSGSGDTMQQLTFIKPGTLEWREVPKPTIQGPKEAIVRPIAVARCDVDFAIYTGLFPAQGPFAVGHEFNGEVVEVGEGVKNFKVGDEVICSFQIACGECEYCRRGQARSCTAVTRGAMYGFNRGYGGAHSDYVHVPFADYMLIEKPASLDPVSIASISDNVIDGWRTVARQRRCERQANPAFDTRAVLYEKVISFIVQRCFAARGGSEDDHGVWTAPSHWQWRELPRRGAAGDTPRVDDAVAEIHAQWLMTPRDDLRGQTPRDVLHAQRSRISEQIQDREHQWTRFGQSPLPLWRESTAYRLGGYGTHENIVYYDLLRHLIHECW